MVIVKEYFNVILLHFACITCTLALFYSKQCCNKLDVLFSTDVTGPQTIHYIRFSIMPYEEAYSKFNVLGDNLVNAVLDKAVLDALNSSIINTIQQDNSFSATQLRTVCNPVAR